MIARKFALPLYHVTKIDVLFYSNRSNVLRFNTSGLRQRKSPTLIGVPMTLTQRAKRFFLLFLIVACMVPAFAQEDDEDEDDNDVERSPIISTRVGDDYKLYTRGDQVFCISLGLLFPLFFTDNNGHLITNNINLGGTGSLGYLYFLDSHFFIGGELQGSFSQTLGKNFYYCIPIGFKVGYQFVVSRFEFPLSMTIGGATQQYAIDNNLYGLFLKWQASGFFRFSPEWSFGLNTAWWLVPQWPYSDGKRDKTLDTTGNFLELTLSARYHF
jgi:hypothetical protein